MKDNGLLLVDVAEKLRRTREFVVVPSEIRNLATYMACFFKDNESITPEELVTVLRKILGDLYLGRTNPAYKLSVVVKLECSCIISSVKSFPLVIDKIASKEFSNKFREIFIGQIGSV